MAKATACKEIQGSRIPDLYGSINNTFKYKGFDLSILVHILLVVKYWMVFIILYYMAIM